MEVLDRQLADLEYPAEQLASYVAENDAGFLGPRTEWELWESKVNRGYDTTPHYVTREMDFEEEAKKDRENSSRDCPHCGYPSPDYRSRCKRCDCPHGRFGGATE